MNPQTGKLLILIGLAILVVGVAVYFFHDHLKWIGRLPGDIRIRKENFSLYFPLTTMIVLSILASLLLWLFRKL